MHNCCVVAEEPNVLKGGLPAGQQCSRNAAKACDSVQLSNPLMQLGGEVMDFLLPRAAKETASPTT